MKRVTGLSNVQKGTTTSDEQEVLIREAGGRVCLTISNPHWSARMTPDEARFLATLLVEAANRMDEETKSQDTKAGSAAPDRTERSRSEPSVADAGR